VERLARDKHPSLLAPFLSFEENELKKITMGLKLLPRSNIR
jgi:hypothetical protein